MHEIDVVEKYCHDCSKMKPIVYIETYFTFDGRVGLNYCNDCGSKKTNHLKDGICIVIRQD